MPELGVVFASGSIFCLIPETLKPSLRIRGNVGVRDEHVKLRVERVEAEETGCTPL